MSGWSNRIVNQATPRSMGLRLETRNDSARWAALAATEHDQLQACERALADALFDQALGRAMVVRRIGCAYFLAPVGHEAVALMATECVAGVPLLDCAREAWLMPYEGAFRLVEIRQALEEALAEVCFVEVDWRKAVDPDGLAL